MEWSASEASDLLLWDHPGSQLAQKWTQDSLVGSAEEGHASDMADGWEPTEVFADAEEVEDEGIAGLLEGLDRIAHRIERARGEMVAEVEAASRTWPGRTNMKPSCADSYASDDGRRTQANRHGFAAVLTHLVEEGSKVAGTHVNDWKSRLVALGQRVEKTLSLHELYQEKSEETLGALLAELKDLQVRLAVSESGRQVLEASIPRIARSISQSYCTNENECQNEWESTSNRNDSTHTAGQESQESDWKQARFVRILVEDISTWKGLKHTAASFGPCVFLCLPFLSYLATRK